MIRIGERKNNRLITVIYTDEAAGKKRSAIRLLLKFRKTEGFEPRYITLRDLDHSADEGNHSREMRVGATEKEISDAMAEHPCGKLYLAGSYQGVRTGIGIDMKKAPY